MEEKGSALVSRGQQASERVDKRVCQAATGIDKCLVGV